MKICPDCKKPIPEDSVLCPYCLYTFEVKRQTPSPAPALKPESAPASVSPRSEFNPKLPSMTLGQEPMTDPEKYSSYVHNGKGRKKLPWYIWGIVVFIFIVIVVVVDNANEGRSASIDDISYPAYASPESNGELEKAVESPSPETDAEVEEVSQQSEFVIADSDSRYLTEADLNKLTVEERRIARNEIYARHHRLFDDEGLQEYFNGCSWYEGIVSPSDFSEAYAASVFNEYELFNKDFILAYEKEHN